MSSHVVMESVELSSFVEVSCHVFLFLSFFNRGGHMYLRYPPDRWEKMYNLIGFEISLKILS